MTKNGIKRYPIAEHFLSPQGEGLFAGQLQFFIRFAGCSVGKKMSGEQRALFLADERLKSNGRLEVLATYREMCTLYDGRTFACDTDFQTKKVMTVEEILAMIPSGVQHICLTGGEPLDHDLSPLLFEIASKTDYLVHIETSGTVSLTDRAYPEYSAGDSLDMDGGWIWLTVSPKFNALPEMMTIANEIKLLVDDRFDLAKIPDEVLEHDLVFIQPVNFELEINKKNMEMCLELQKEHPNWRISSQSHKLWNVR
jgi:7-carboxy-7-deazaguanine synthase